MFTVAIAFPLCMTDITSMTLRLTFAALFSCLAIAPGMAASSAWHEAAGGRVRLVTTGPIGSDGTLRGALQIDLQPGWKTYWRDPGSAGVPPQIDISAGGEWSSAAFDFPAPQRHEDESGTWAGYDYPVALPVMLRAAPGKTPKAVKGSVFLGLCEKICIPLQATIDLTIDTASTPAEESAIVEFAWSSLPAAATAGYGVEGAITDSKAAGVEVIALKVEAPAPVTDLFLAGEDGYIFGATHRTDSDDRALFTVDIVSRPKKTPAGPGLHYTLVTAKGAVSGLIPYP